MPPQQESVSSQRQKKQPAEKKNKQPVEEDTRSQREEKEPVEEEKKMQHTGYLRLQTFEAPRPEPFMVAKVDDPLLKREQFALETRKSKKNEIISKKRWDLVLNQLQREEVQYSEMAFSHLPE